MVAERRSSHRVPIPDGQGEAILRIGRCEFSVCVTNASRLGFAVACPTTANTKCGDLLRLSTKDEEWIQVRVVHVQPISDQLIIGLARENMRGDDQGRGLLAAAGDRAAALFIVAAVIAGLLVGLSRVTEPLDVLANVRAAIRAHLSPRH